MTGAAPSLSPAPARIHASCVAIGGQAVLLSGPSGSGKSDLALRLIDRGAVLVSDDQVLLDRRGQRLFAAPPTQIAGMIEVRGLGIRRIAYITDMPVAMLIDLAAPPERMPPPAIHREVAGVDLPVIALAPFEASAPIKVELALADLAAGAGA